MCPPSQKKEKEKKKNMCPKKKKTIEYDRQRKLNLVKCIFVYNKNI